MNLLRTTTTLVLWLLLGCFLPLAVVVDAQTETNVEYNITSYLYNGDDSTGYKNLGFLFSFDFAVPQPLGSEVECLSEMTIGTSSKSLGYSYYTSEMVLVDETTGYGVLDLPSEFADSQFCSNQANGPYFIKSLRLNCCEPTGNGCWSDYVSVINEGGGKVYERPEAYIYDQTWKSCFNYCGDGEIGSVEGCDGQNNFLNDKTCLTEGFSGGTLQCDMTTCTLSTDHCSICGDNVRDLHETCDGTDLGSLTCSDFGFDGGTLGCGVSCNSFDTSLCYACGDGLLNADVGEECDGYNLNGLSCEDLGFVGGALACDSSCRYDTSGCTTESPSMVPSSTPSSVPTTSKAPSERPSLRPTATPSSDPSSAPSSAPSERPSLRPTTAPTGVPTTMPSSDPSVPPSSTPTSTPITLLSIDFDDPVQTSGFVFVPNAFGASTASTSDHQIEGFIDDTDSYGRNNTGGIKIILSSAGIAEDVSGAWTYDFTLTEAIEHVRLSFYYRIRFQNGFDPTDEGAIWVGIDDNYLAKVNPISGDETS